MDERPSTENAGNGLDVVWDGPVLRLTLDRPRAGNSLTRAVVQDLLHVLDEVAESNETRVIALTGTGRHFCTGMDLREANTQAATRPRTGHVQRGMGLRANRLIRAFAEVQLPVVAGVRGWAAGLGNTLALASDYVVASRTAKFWTPFVKRGFAPDSASTYLLPRLIGLPRAKQMILLGRPVEAEQAESWGMVQEVVDDDRLEERFEAVVAEFATSATVAVGLAKTLLHRNLELDLDQSLAAEGMAVEVSLRSQDYKEGMKAFAEGRDPHYHGL